MVVVDYDLLELVEVRLETDEMLMFRDVLELEDEEQKHQMPVLMQQIEQIDDLDIDEVDDEVEVDITTEIDHNLVVLFALQLMVVMQVDIIDEIEDALETE